MCILLYDERVNTHARMQEIDIILDDNPELSAKMVELDNRNRQAHEELQAYNNHKVFIYKHPLVIQRHNHDKQLTELYELKRTDPDALIAEITNVTQNIRRIQSNLNKQKFKTEEERQSWEDNLARAKLRKQIIGEVISK